jgi:hypothetical protein
MEKRLLGKVVLSSIGAFFVFSTYASETLEVCIKIDKNKIVRKTDITNDDLLRFGRFGIDAPHFDAYYRVISAQYIDRFGKDYVELEKDLTENVPSMTCSTSLSHSERDKFRFPKFVSASFINSVEESEANKKPFFKNIYKERNSRTELSLQYRIEYVDKSHKKVVIPS